MSTYNVPGTSVSQTIAYKDGGAAFCALRLLRNYTKATFNPYEGMREQLAYAWQIGWDDAASLSKEYPQQFFTLEGVFKYFTA